MSYKVDINIWSMLVLIGWIILFTYGALGITQIIALVGAIHALISGLTIHKQ